MATRRYSIQRGDQLPQVVEAVGAPTASKSIELTVDLAVVQSKQEVLTALLMLHDWIMQGGTSGTGLWPPA